MVDHVIDHPGTTALAATAGRDAQLPQAAGARDDVAIPGMRRQIGQCLDVIVSRQQGFGTALEGGGFDHGLHEDFITQWVSYASKTSSSGSSCPAFAVFDLEQIAGALNAQSRHI